MVRLRVVRGRASENRSRIVQTSLSCRIELGEIAQGNEREGEREREREGELG